VHRVTRAPSSWACLLALVAPSAPAALAQTPRPDLVTFRPLRFDENYRHLRDSVRHGWWQRLKCIPGAAVTESGPGLAMNYLLVSTTFTF